MKAIVSEKGQVTIPKALRDRLGIKPGQVLEFAEERGTLLATKAGLEDPVESVSGMLKTDLSTEEMMKQLRGPRKRS